MSRVAAQKPIGTLSVFVGIIYMSTNQTYPIHTANTTACSLMRLNIAKYPEGYIDDSLDEGNKSDC